MAFPTFDIFRSRGGSAFRAVFAMALLAMAALPASAVTVAVRSGAPNNNLGNTNSVASLYGSWTQTTTYLSVNVAATLCSGDGSPATATVYLTNSIGAGTTIANQIASRTITLSSPCSGIGVVSTQLFSGLSLPPATYYLVVSNLSGALQWALVSGGATETLGTGVTTNSDEFSLITAPYPPADTTFGPVSFGGSSHVLLYSITSTPPGANPTPTLSSWALAGTMILLAGYGLFVMGKLRQHSSERSGGI